MKGIIVINPEDDQTKTGLCHARGMDAGLPPFWLFYITIENFEASATLYQKLGGKIIVTPREIGEYGLYCVIQDPARAYGALYETKK